MKNAKLEQKHTWLSFSPDYESYLPASYYNSILKEYNFNSQSDLEIFKKDLPITVRSSLEFGPGNGRVTSIFLKNRAVIGLELVDLSKQMLNFCKKRFESYPITYTQSDAIQFILNTKKQYDFIYSLWSLSHSVHQTLQKEGLSKGTAIVEKALLKLFSTVLGKDGCCYIVHFDSLSDEQRISIKQRKKYNAVYQYSLEQQSPSKLLFDKVLKELQKEKKVDFVCGHLIGEEIVFSSIEEALEYYFNFHMEGLYNKSDKIEEMIKEVENDLLKNQKEDGTISVKPGCFIYKIRRLV